LEFPLLYVRLLARTHPLPHFRIVLKWGARVGASLTETTDLVWHDLNVLKKKRKKEEETFSPA